MSARELKRFGPYHWWVDMETSLLFDEFTTDHPYVYSMLLDLLQEYRMNTGHTIGSVYLLWNKMRWELEVHLRDHVNRMTEKERRKVENEGSYKLNDKFSPGYARLIMANNPRLGEIFELRCPVGCPICPPRRKKYGP